MSSSSAAIWAISATALLGCGGIEASSRDGGPPNVVDAGPDALDAARRCEVQRARPPSAPSAEDRFRTLGYSWNGFACAMRLYPDTSVPNHWPPTGCVGEDCAALVRTQEECVAQHASCGARLEQPPRGAEFTGTPGAGVPCGPTTCAPGTECAYGVVPICLPPDPDSESHGVSRLRCDDATDCGATGVCCVLPGTYVHSKCQPACAPAEGGPACTSAADCREGEHCCKALASYVVTLVDVGVCTPHPCDD